MVSPNRHQVLTERRPQRFMDNVQTFAEVSHIRWNFRSLDSLTRRRDPWLMLPAAHETKQSLPAVTGVDWTTVPQPHNQQITSQLQLKRRIEYIITYLHIHVMDIIIDHHHFVYVFYNYHSWYSSLIVRNALIISFIFSRK